MTKRVEFQETVSCLQKSLEEVPEHRKGHNVQYDIVYAGLGGPPRAHSGAVKG